MGVQPIEDHGERRLRIICLVNNQVGGYHPSRYSLVARLGRPGARFLAEHGLSFLIETDAKELILMDGGSSGIPLLHNLGLIGVKPVDIGTVFLTHGHYDHADGLASLPIGLKLITHPESLSRTRISTSGFRQSPSDTMLGWAERGRLELSHESMRLGKGVTTTGEIHVRHEQESFDGSTFVNGKGEFPDNFIDEQGLILESDMGAVLLTGCAHPGIVSMVERAAELSNKDLFMVMGGFHMMGASRERLEWTTSRLKEMGIEIIAPMHCTSYAAQRFLSLRFEGFELMAAGSMVDLRVPNVDF